MNEINFTSVKHVLDEDGNNAGLVAVHDGKTTAVSCHAQSRFYTEIMRQVEAGTLTIADAD